MVPAMAGVDHESTTIAVASRRTEAHGISPQFAVPASISPVARQTGIPTPTVSNDVASAIVFANHIKVPMSPFSPDIISQDNLESTEFEQNPLVNCLAHVFLAGADDHNRLSIDRKSVV